MIAKQIDTNYTIPFGTISNISLFGIIQKKDLGSNVWFRKIHLKLIAQFVLWDNGKYALDLSRSYECFWHYKNMKRY